VAEDEDRAEQAGDKPETRFEPASRMPPDVIIGSPFLSLAEAGAWVSDRVIEPVLRGRVGVGQMFDSERGGIIETRVEIGRFTLLKQAAETLKLALARGELVATGVNAKTGLAEVIPALFWERAYVATFSLPPKWPDGRATLKNGQEPWRDIRIDRKQLERAWPIDVAREQDQAGRPSTAGSDEQPELSKSNIRDYRKQDIPRAKQLINQYIADGERNWSATARKLFPDDIARNLGNGTPNNIRSRIIGCARSLQRAGWKG
jgi:hypothetical protein